MLATLVTAVIDGLHGSIVHVEVDVAPGLPVCHIVGLPDAALSEARERVRGALRNSGFEYPLSRITVNLAPADRRKRGAALSRDHDDLARDLGRAAIPGPRTDGQSVLAGRSWVPTSLRGVLGSASMALATSVRERPSADSGRPWRNGSPVLRALMAVR